MRVKRTRDVLRKKDIPKSMGTGFSKRESLQLTSVFRILLSLKLLWTNSYPFA